VLPVEPTHSQTRRRSLIRTAVSICLVVSIAAVGIAQRTPLAHAYHLATSRYPESYTELSFDQVAKLPTQVTAGGAYSYTVHVANHEGAVQTYELVATLATPGVTTATQTVTIRLQDGASADQTFTFSLPLAQTAAVVTVSLPAQQQSITFRTRS